MVVVLASWPRVHHPTTPSETPSPLRPSGFFFRCWETAPPPPPVRRALALIEAELDLAATPARDPATLTPKC